jgi:hypothetical protein
MLLLQLTLLVWVSLVQLGAKAEVLRAGGYPGYVEPNFGLAPRRAEGRSLFYRSSPKVARARSSVHELYMRPYNYVSYKMGGSGGGSQYKYQYKTLHPQYGGYKPSPYQTPTPQPVTATPFYHSSPAYHTSAPYHAPTVATYQAPTYRYQPYSYPTTPSPTPQCILPPPTANLEHAAVAVLAKVSRESFASIRRETQPLQWKCPAISPAWLQAATAFISTSLVTPPMDASLWQDTSTPFS